VFEKTHGPTLKEFLKLHNAVKASYTRALPVNPTQWMIACADIENIRDQFWADVTGIRDLNIPVTMEVSQMEAIIAKTGQRSTLLGRLISGVVRFCTKLESAVKHLHQRLRNFKKRQVKVARAVDSLSQSGGRILVGQRFGYQTSVALEHLHRSGVRKGGMLTRAQLEMIMISLLSDPVLTLRDLLSQRGVDTTCWSENEWGGLARQLLEAVPCALYKPALDTSQAVLISHAGDPTSISCRELLNNFWRGTVFRCPLVKASLTTPSG
jgi:hypothetical protein